MARSVIRYLGRRVLVTLPTLWLVTVVVFSMVRLLPGDPAETIAGLHATQESVAGLRQELGLDRPLLVQYGQFLAGLLRLDLGRSTMSRAPVLEELGPRLPVSLTLAVLSMGVAIVAGVLLGVLAALGRRSWVDYLAMSVSVAGLSTPTFVLGLILILVLSVQWRLLPATGAGTWGHYILPAVTLGLPAAAVVARMARSSLLEVLRQDFVRTAWAKGLSRRSVVYRHALKNALIPVLTISGLQFGQLMGGAVVVESVFGLPGLGKLLVDRVLGRDYPVIQGVVLVAACGFVLTNLVVDLVYSLVDPRIRPG
jgi:ABC-type dipeptide/oligopeptide/nickel transport system permease component